MNLLNKENQGHLSVEDKALWEIKDLLMPTADVVKPKKNLAPPMYFDRFEEPVRVTLN